MNYTPTGFCRPMPVDHPLRNGAHGRPLLFDKNNQPLGPIPTIGVSFHNGALLVTIHVLVAPRETSTRTSMFAHAGLLTEWITAFQRDPEGVLEATYGYTGFEAPKVQKGLTVVGPKAPRRVLTVDDL